MKSVLGLKYMKMKKLFLLGILLKVVGVNAADLYVNNSGQAGTYTTISAAITAAAANDRIFVSPYGVYSENLIIAKSLTITSAVANTRFSVVGSVTVTSAPNQDVVIIGGEFSGGVTGNTGTATLAVKGNLTVSDCKIGSLTTSDFIKSKVLFSDILGTANIRHGSIIGSQIGTITIQDGPNAGVGDTLCITGNKVISSNLNWSNNDNYFAFSNNFIKGAIFITTFQYSTSIKNVISNNTLSGDSGSNSIYGNGLRLIGFPNANMSNIEIFNNLFIGMGTDIGCGSGTCNNFIGAAKFYYNIYNNVQPFSGFSAVVGNISNPGNITVDLFGKSINELVVNQGSPALQHYDIDLTRNDMGTFGGPYSIDNYWNTATGRARVYDLTMPFEIWNGSTPSIKAEGTHIK
jgi:hypothetical protein